MSNIQWTDVTDNPIAVEGGGWWCKKISPGCANCYAEKLNHNSFFGGNFQDYSGNPPQLILKRKLIESWSRMRSSKKHFVCSMTDIFGDWVPVPWQLEILAAMTVAPKQTFQILTKRPENALQTINHYLSCNSLLTLPSNIWIGTSVENQRCADNRIYVLNQIPAKVRFLSVEPLLEKVDLKLPRCSIQWIIVGGESGKNSRPCSLEWIEFVVNQCKKTDVPVFVKQLGSKPYGGGEQYITGVSSIKLKDKKGGEINEFPAFLQVRQFPV